MGEFEIEDTTRRGAGFGGGAGSGHYDHHYGGAEEKKEAGNFFMQGYLAVKLIHFSLYRFSLSLLAHLFEALLLKIQFTTFHQLSI